MTSWSSTCWVAIHDAASGDPQARDRFARRYVPVVTSYLEARWKGFRRSHDIDDALQEVFIECFRAGGALERADPALPGGFRAFLYGITRNVAARIEQRRGRRRETPIDTAFSDDHPSPKDEDLARVFDRAWARSVMREAFETQEREAARKGEAARQRVDLLRLRFEDGLAIRQIAERWNADPDRLHNEYVQARREFGRALREVVAFHMPGATGEVDRECRILLEALA